MRDELLSREIFYSLKEAQVMIEMWRREYNTIRPHSALGYRPPTPEAILFQPTQFQQVGLTYGVVHTELLEQIATKGYYVRTERNRIVISAAM